jgi:plastocyanin
MRTSFTRRYFPAAIAFAVAIVLAIAALAPNLHKAAAQDATAVSIVDFEFQPASMTVAEGTTVTWTNNGAANHSATSDTGVFDTGIMAPGTSGSFTFADSGTFTYHCMVHPFMLGTITVTGAGAAGAAAAPTAVPSIPATGVGFTDAGSSGTMMAALLGLSGLFLAIGVVAFRRRAA